MVLIARDSSTLKVLRKNSKVCESCCAPPGGPGTGEDCVFCPANTAPEKITVTISGVTDCAGCISGADGPWCSVPWIIRGYSNVNVASLVNHSFLLKQTEAQACIWETDWINDSSGSVTFWSSSNCTGTSFSTSTQRYMVRVVRGAPGGGVMLDFILKFQGSCGFTAAGFRTTDSPESGTCVEYTNIINSRVSECTGQENNIGMQWGITENGIFTIEEGDTHDCRYADNWHSWVTYSGGDYVRHTPITRLCYKCILGHTDKEPPNATYWSLMDYP